jgi:hypothetical protein
MSHDEVDVQKVRKKLELLEADIESGAIDPNAPLPTDFEFCKPTLSPLAAAARLADEELFDALIAVKKVNPCTLDSDGRSVLMHAVLGVIEGGELEVLRKLLKRPEVIAQVNHKAEGLDGKPETALDLAGKVREVADLLKAKGAIALRTHT